MIDQHEEVAMIRACLVEAKKGAERERRIFGKVRPETTAELARLQYQLSAKESLAQSDKVVASNSDALGTARADTAEIHEDGAGATTSQSSVFICYSHNDASWKDSFRELLRPAFPGGLIWHDGAIGVGDDWQLEIDKALNSCNIALLLVSESFLNSDYIVQRELPRLIKASSLGQVRLAWILLRDCLWEETELAGIQAAHDTNKPLSVLSRAERATAMAAIGRKVASLRPGYAL